MLCGSLMGLGAKFDSGSRSRVVSEAVAEAPYETPKISHVSTRVTRGQVVFVFRHFSAQIQRSAAHLILQVKIALVHEQSKPAQHSLDLRIETDGNCWERFIVFTRNLTLLQPYNPQVLKAGSESRSSYPFPSSPTIAVDSQVAQGIPNTLFL